MEWDFGGEMRFQWRKHEWCKKTRMNKTMNDTWVIEWRLEWNEHKWRWDLGERSRVKSMIEGWIKVKIEWKIDANEEQVIIWLKKL